jgi:hypothetical protein
VSPGAQANLLSALAEAAVSPIAETAMAATASMFRIGVMFPPWRVTTTRRPPLQ